MAVHLLHLDLRGRTLANLAGNVDKSERFGTPFFATRREVTTLAVGTAEKRGMALVVSARKAGMNVRVGEDMVTLE